MNSPEELAKSILEMYEAKKTSAAASVNTRKNNFIDGQISAASISTNVVSSATNVLNITQQAAVASSASSISSDIITSQYNTQRTLASSSASAMSVGSYSPEINPDYLEDINQIKSQHGGFLKTFLTYETYLASPNQYTIRIYRYDRATFFNNLVVQFADNPKLASTLLTLLGNGELEFYLDCKPIEVELDRSISDKKNAIYEIYDQVLKNKILSAEYRKLAFASLMLIYPNTQELLNNIYKNNDQANYGKLIQIIDILTENNIEIDFEKLNIRITDYAKDKAAALAPSLKTAITRDFLHNIDAHKRQQLDKLINDHIHKIQLLTEFLRTGFNIEKFVKEFGRFISYDCNDFVLIINSDSDIENEALHKLRLLLTATLFSIFKPYCTHSMHDEKIFSESEEKIVLEYKKLLDAAVNAGCFDQLGFEHINLQTIQLGFHSSANNKFTLNDLNNADRLKSIFGRVHTPDRAQRLMTTVTDLINKLQARKNELQNTSSQQFTTPNMIFYNSKQLDLYPEPNSTDYFLDQFDTALSHIERGYKTKFIKEFLKEKFLKYRSYDELKYFVDKLHKLIIKGDPKTLDIINYWRDNYRESFNKIEETAKSLNVSLCRSTNNLNFDL